MSSDCIFSQHKDALHHYPRDLMFHVEIRLIIYTIFKKGAAQILSDLLT